jgi:hypothetical protein
VTSDPAELAEDTTGERRASTAASHVDLGFVGESHAPVEGDESGSYSDGDDGQIILDPA